MHKYSTEELAAQPIGYWSGVVYRAVTDRIRASLGEEQLTQPHWWTLNHVSGAPGTWDRGRLAEKLLPYADADVDFGPVFDDLISRAWLTEASDGALTLSEAGEAGLVRARDRNALSHALIHDGIAPEQYAACVNVLRRMVANLGGDGNLPR
ncbi:MarR family transcriptional regulator [Pseudonocardia sp. MH-G8]|uniref:MarR family transcriptional regulator n=1 Tax=Pseudonocardia sp. MH-G8 TaxID=1854588 RepID=UPI000BA13F33|nr:MarR family transcriptional regulator [Pseudonocardia sp. MH-G8]OZM83009.1 MarR family transcriptional regulator [Pseudonocardia sp. MH-G8]